MDKSGFWSQTAYCSNPGPAIYQQFTFHRLPPSDLLHRYALHQMSWLSVKTCEVLTSTGTGTLQSLHKYKMFYIVMIYSLLGDTACSFIYLYVPVVHLPFSFFFFNLQTCLNFFFIWKINQNSFLWNMSSLSHFPFSLHIQDITCYASFHYFPSLSISLFILVWQPPNPNPTMALTEIASGHLL